LWPAGSRPCIAGSTDDSVLELALGYNGLGRIFGATGPGGGGGGNVAFGGDSGLGRMFGAAFGTEVSWLLPAALIALGAGLWFTRRAPRTDRTRMALLLWGGWLVVTALVFSLMTGIVHPYYAVALAPAVAALVAIAGCELWRGRSHAPARVVLAVLVAVTGVWSVILLGRTSWLPPLRWVILAATVVVATALVFGVRRVAVAAVVTMLAGTGAFTVVTAATPHHGSIPLSGPGQTTGGGMDPGVVTDEVARLLADTDTRWAAATSNANGAAGLALASGRPVIGIGGWSGGDPAPTLAEFQHYVESGQIGYYVEGGGGGMRGDSSIAEWVADTFDAQTINGQTIYDLTPQ
jgi:4-amino-4-deoxy-L-arabinose transferase-like glycosyltransferase